MGVDISCGQEERWVHYEKRRKVKEAKDYNGNGRGKRNSSDSTVLTKAGTLANNNKQEKSRFSTKVLYVDKIY